MNRLSKILTTNFEGLDMVHYDSNKSTAIFTKHLK